MWSKYFIVQSLHHREMELQKLIQLVLISIIVSHILLCVYVHTGPQRLSDFLHSFDTTKMRIYYDFKMWLH